MKRILATTAALALTGGLLAAVLPAGPVQGGSPTATAPSAAAPGAAAPKAEAPAVALRAAPAVRVDPALERTRKQTRMLDTLYKTAVVAITQTYVGARTTTPAGAAAKVIFAAMEKNGFHSARLIDVTGSPTNAENVAVDAFEKEAAAAILAGKPSLEKVEVINGKSVLRTATVVPVVMKQCITCHEGWKLNQPVGALLYKLEIE